MIDLTRKKRESNMISLPLMGTGNKKIQNTG